MKDPFAEYKRATKVLEDRETPEELRWFLPAESEEREVKDQDEELDIGDEF